jgi:hypothetical protein
MMKIEGSGSTSGSESGSTSGSESGSISQRHGSADPDPDPHQNVMDPEHRLYCGVLLSYPPLCPAGLRLLQVFGSFHIGLLHRHIQIKALQRNEKVTVATYLNIQRLGWCGVTQ